MTDTAINAGLRIALEQVNAALSRHGIEPSGDYGADIERLAVRAHLPDGWEPTDVEVFEWMIRNDLEDQWSSQMRTAIDDARSMHLISSAKAKGHSL